jgi:fatty acid desaturase
MSQSYVDASVLKRLSVLRPRRTAGAITFDWAVIAGCILASQITQNIAVYVLAVVLIGGRMHALGVLLHDFAHYRFIDKRKKLSDWICELLISWPLLTTVDGYRRNHLAHHRYTNTDKDPDWVFKLGSRKFTFPQAWQEAVLTLLSYLIVLGSVLDIIGVSRRLASAERPSLAARLARLFYYLAWALLLTLTNSWALFGLYWAIPYVTVFFLFLHIRSVAEHFGSMDYSQELGSTRTVIPFFWERALFAPHHVNFHLEHHLYPSVPFYNLPTLHQAAMQNPTFAAQAHLTRGYTTGLVAETLGVKSTKTAPAQ